MRLPLATPLKTRPGNNTKDARIKNGCIESRGEQSVVRKRAGSIDITDTGGSLAQLLAFWSGYIITIDSDWVNVYDENDDLVFSQPLYDTWDANTTYGIGDIVWYDDLMFYGMTPDNLGNTPGGSFWSQTAPTNLRWYVEANIPTFPYPYGPECADPDSAIAAFYALGTAKDCATKVSNIWWINPRAEYNGSIWVWKMDGWASTNCLSESFYGVYSYVIRYKTV